MWQELSQQKDPGKEPQDFISWHLFCLEGQVSLQGDSFGIRQVDSEAAA